MPLHYLKVLPPGGSIMSRFTDAVAILAVLTGLNPDYYWYISQTSQVAALFLPILGCIWLGVQIWGRVAKGK